MTSTQLKPIILYDIPCVRPGLPWSPNTMITRYCLGYKELPFKTVWVEVPDIAGLLQSKGVTQPPYTLPAIEDPNTGAVVVDSLAIATYLDETYPDTPKVLNRVVHDVLDKAGGMLSPGPRPGVVQAQGVGGSDADEYARRLVFIVLNNELLNPVSRAYYHEKRTAHPGERWTALADACSASPEGRAEEVRRGIEAFKGAWLEATTLYDPAEGKPSARFTLGEDSPTFVDFLVAGRVKYVLQVLSQSEAETLQSVGGGRLARLVEDLERYYKY